MSKGSTIFEKTQTTSPLQLATGRYLDIDQIPGIHGNL